MENAIIEVVVNVLAELALTLIGVAGAWLVAKLAKRAELAGIQSATDELVTAAQLTVMELQQTTVEGLKEASADGKLSPEDITRLGQMLLKQTMQKMSEPSIKLLQKAGTDTEAIIRGAGEALIAKIKAGVEVE